MEIFDKIKLSMPFFFAPPAPNINTRMGKDENYEPRNDLQAFHGGYRPIFNVSYDGEKNQGSIGAIKRYFINPTALRARSWQAYLESEIAQGFINKFSSWIIGRGLKLKSNPEITVLESEGITNVNKQQFSKIVEARFKIFARSKKISHSKLQNLHEIAQTAHINTLIGGDALVILRLVNQNITVELIDGSQVLQPSLLSTFHAKAKKRGNRIRHGIELNKAGEHIAYYIRKDFKTTSRILTKTAGRLTAFMIYGLEYRIDSIRGIPLISVVLESIKKLDRYREATVGSAEERQKIAFAIEHTINSTGENPMLAQMKAAHNADAEIQTGNVDGEAVANKIAATTDKQVFNMPIGAQLKSLEAKNELYYKDFYTTNINSIASAILIPPEVALSKYDSNFSASRAALKDWEHVILVKREKFSSVFYQNIYNFWLEIQILQQKVQAPGYLLAFGKNDMVIESYQHARFVGANVPHIDPLKEVKAERLKLGNNRMPLTTGEAATEALNSGEFDANVEQFIQEIDSIEDIKDETRPAAEVEPPEET